MGRTWELRFLLPTPTPREPAPETDAVASASRVAQRAAPPPEPQRERPLFAITGIEPASDGRLVVRVHVEDTSRTFEVDRLVRPEVIRLFREQFATGANAGRREEVRWMTEDNGRTIVYHAEFASEE